MVSMLAILALSGFVIQGKAQSANGLQTAVFELPQGKITVYIPSDMRAGDTISGTVIAAPTGTGSAMEANGAILKGMVVELGGATPKHGGIQPSWVLPAAAVGIMSLSLKGPGGNPIGACDVVSIPPGQGAGSGGGFGCDPIVQQGRPIPLNGSFDGNSSNTNVMVGGQLAGVLAESPRSCLVAGEQQNPGPCDINVRESGQSQSMKCQVIAVRLSAPKTTLLRGEKTTLSVQVTGLRGLDKKHFPIPVEVTNMTPSIVAFEHSQGSPLALELPLASVRGDVGNLQVGLIAINPGPFVMGAVVFGVSIHDMKRMMDLPTFKTWLDGVIASYEVEIMKLVQTLADEKAGGGKGTGTTLKLTRYRQHLQTMKMCVTVKASELGDCKESVDQVLARDNMLSVATQLVSAAADLLGYTSLPLPKVTAILKGLSIMAGQLPKVLNAIEAALAAAELYEKASDLADKAEKLKTLKDAVDTVRQALDE
jgi:hypothetical protein